MITKEILVNELVKNGYSQEGDSKEWSIAKRYFRYINPEMAEAFMKLREHPRAKATIIDSEIKLLKENISDLLKETKDEKFNLIDISCIDGMKAKEILKALPKDMKIRYCPVSVNEHFVNLSLENVKKEKFQNVADYSPQVTKDFEDLDEVGAALRNNNYQRNVYLFLGSIISNFEINHYLFKLSQSMLPGDIMIMGNGIRTGPRLANLETYQDKVFNDWLIHLMRTLGFKDEEVEYHARFAHNRLEGCYKIKADKTFDYEKRKIKLKKGDNVIVTFQYKFFEQELKDFCNLYFDEVKLIKDPVNEYVLVACKR